jgi:hypothetical protein
LRTARHRRRPFEPHRMANPAFCPAPRRVEARRQRLLRNHGSEGTVGLRLCTRDLAGGKLPHQGTFRYASTDQQHPTALDDDRRRYRGSLHRSSFRQPCTPGRVRLASTCDQLSRSSGGTWAGRSGSRWSPASSASSRGYRPGRSLRSRSLPSSRSTSRIDSQAQPAQRRSRAHRLVQNCGPGQAGTGIPPSRSPHTPG